MAKYSSPVASDTSWPGVSRSTEEHEEIWVPRHQLEDALRELVRDIIPGAALLFGGLCIAQGLVLYATFDQGLVGAIAVSIVVGSCLILIAFAASQFEIPLPAANPAAFAIALAASGVALFNLRASSEPLFTMPFFLFLAATSMLFLERRWFIGHFVTSISLWLAVGWNVYLRQEWPYYGLSLLCVVGITTWLFFSRHSTLTRLTHFQLQEEKRKELLMVRVDDAFKSSAELFELTVRDPLTGAYNRRYLAQLRSDLELEGKRWGVLLIDLDGFKEINDRLGHDAGDRALQRMAHFIRRQARAEDRLIRYGGDEFLLLIDVKADDEVGQIAERFREVAQREAPLAFSMGAVSRREGESLRSLLQRGDQAMYADKSSNHTYERLGLGRVRQSKS